jgi:predicted CXXCH cytochrome family protein
MNLAIRFLAVGVASLGGLGAMASLNAPASIPRMRLDANHQCSFCHNTHHGVQPSLLVASNVEVLCLTCHGPAGASTLKAANHVGQTCTVCHNPHDGETNRFGRRNLMMLKSDVVARDSTTHRPLTFESRGTDVGQPALHSFCDNDLDGDHVYDNVCDTCHRNSPDRHKYPSTGSHGHETGRTCTNCHQHRREFRPD